MTKKILVLIAVLALGLFAACQKNEVTTDTAGTDTSATTETSMTSSPASLQIPSKISSNSSA